LSELKRRYISAAPSKTAPASSPDVAGQFQYGQSLHGQGRLEEAEGLYRAVLAQAPRHFDAMHKLGVIALQKRQHAVALELIERALAINPNLAAAHFNRGLVLHDLRRLDEAVSSYGRALELKPDNADGFIRHGNLLFELARLDEALASYDRVLQLK